MKNKDSFWSPDDLFIIVTNENEGYLAVNFPYNEWIYLNFGEGDYILNNVEDISYAFNEEVKVDE